MADVFISYASEDARLVRELVRILENQRWSVFWDRDLLVGGDFEKQLEHELSAARCVVVLWSRYSTESTWVRAEAHEALKRNCLVPARIDDSQLPFVFRTTETADLVGWPIESRAVDLRKLIMAVKFAVEGAMSQESSRRDLKIRDDPTLSVRVAHRVLDALTGPGGDSSELELETIVADAALARLSGSSGAECAQMLLDQLMSLFESSGGILIADEQEYLQAPLEDREDLLAIVGQASESAFRSSNGADSGYCCLVSNNGKSKLAFVVGQQSTMPPARLERLETALGTILAG